MVEITSGLSMNIRCHVKPYSILCLLFTKSDIRPQVNWPVTLVTTVGHFIFLKGFVCVCMGPHAHFITTARAQLNTVYFSALTSHAIPPGYAEDLSAQLLQTREPHWECLLVVASPVPLGKG